MAHGRLTLCTTTTGWQLDGAPAASVKARPGPDVIAAAREVATSTGWVEIGGPAPGISEHLEDVVSLLAARGLSIRLASGPHGLNPPRISALAQRGLGILRLRVHGADATVHERITGDPGAFARLTALAEHAGSLGDLKLELRASLTRGSVDRAPAYVARAQSWGTALELERLVVGRTDPVAWRALAVPLDEARDAAERVRRAADEAGVAVTLHGMSGPPAPWRGAGEPVPISPSLWRALRDDAGSSALLAGCHTDVAPEVWAQTVALAGGVDALPVQLAAWRCPVVDLPPEAGGAGASTPADRARWLALGGTPGAPVVCTPAPGRRVALILPPLRDKVMVTSTFPALARELAARGADVTWSSVWGPLGADPSSTVARSDPAALDVAGAAEPGMWRSLDLSDRDVVVVPGFDAALRVLDHPTLRPDARVVVADFHLLHGIDAWTNRWVGTGRRSMDGGWWPSERVCVHSCFPGFARIYRFMGVPMRQVLWRPYPFDLTAFGPGPPAVQASQAFAGGNQKRDWATLSRAVERTGGTLAHPIRLYTRHAPPGDLPKGLGWAGTVSLPAFHAALASSRYVVLPVPYERHVASGLTVVGMALAAGRPVLSTRTPGMRDHVRQGQGGWLVTPGRADELADALRRFDQDDGWVDAMSGAAGAAGRRASVASWAQEILEGGAVPRVVDVGGGAMAPW